MSVIHIAESPTSLALYAGAPAARWTCDEFQALPQETVTTDIHRVTECSKLDTVWEGVSADTLLAEAFSRGVSRRRTPSRCPTVLLAPDEKAEQRETSVDTGPKIAPR